MPNIRFILDNDAIDSATLSAGGSGAIDTEYPLDNIKRTSRSKPMRSVDAESATTIDIKGTMAEAQEVQAMVLARHNFSETINYQLFLYSDDNWATPVADYTPVEYTVTSSQAAISGLYEWGEFAWGTITWGADKPDLDNRNFYDIALWLDQPYTIKSFTITISVLSGAVINPFFCDEETILCDGSVVGNPTFPIITCDMVSFGGSGGSGESGMPYYEIGRVYLGPYIEPLYNLSSGHSIAWVENTTQYRPGSGTLRADKVTSNKSFGFSLATIPESDRLVLHKQIVGKGLSDDFYISIFPEDASSSKEVDYSGMVKLTKMPKYTNYISGYYKSNFIMEEI